MKRWIAFWLVMLVVTIAMHACIALAQGDRVEVATASITNCRGDSSGAYINGTYYYEGTSLLFTNCVLHSGSTTNSDVQELSNVTVQVMIGTTSSSTTNTATIQSTNNGTWQCTVTVPTDQSSPNVQIKITDYWTNSYIYPWKAMKCKEAL